MSQGDNDNPPLHKLLNVGLAVVVGIAIVGYFLGTGPASEPGKSWMVAPPAASGSAIPGQTYRDLRERRVGPNAVTRSDLGSLRAALPSPTAPVVQTNEQRREALAARQTLRAFEGAPPAIPHTINEQSSASCAACHEKGLRVGDRLAPPMSHPPYASCTQCHAPPAPRFATPTTVSNSFPGYRPEQKGDRASPGAPPSIPHPVHMRESCSSCHGVAGRAGIRTTHPDRGNCEQCHAHDTRLAPRVGIR